MGCQGGSKGGHWGQAATGICKPSIGGQDPEFQATRAPAILVGVNPVFGRFSQGVLSLEWGTGSQVSRESRPFVRRHLNRMGRRRGPRENVCTHLRVQLYTSLRPSTTTHTSYFFRFLLLLCFYKRYQWRCRVRPTSFTGFHVIIGELEETRIDLEKKQQTGHCEAKRTESTLPATKYLPTCVHHKRVRVARPNLQRHAANRPRRGGRAW
ncbi:hypothetical protein QBC35DRAFT_17971 [Podospora australis]|uniref:Uncharacterized protein n=1 Tax=Podospora australis TaxID=1536484 RepID=A0AAN7AFG8_9PEZI|nr:hypothetical protein QBC35DRAFT_17971 [Podospora australis]